MRNRTLTHSRTTKLLIALAVLGLAGALSGLAVAGSLSVSTPRIGSNVNVPAAKAAALADRMPSAPTDAASSVAASSARSAAAAGVAAEPIPAAILGANVPVPISSAVLAETNGWLVSDGSNLVAVYAGARADDSSQGRVVIVRQDLNAATQTVQIVDAGSTGALAIAAGAPSGAAVETSAQTGSLTLNTAHGGTVKLNLATNAISTK